MIDHPSRSRKPLSTGEKRQQLRRLCFAGREEHLQAFRENWRRHPQSLTFANVIRITGQAGVGKRFLLRWLEEIASEQPVLTVLAGDGIPHILDFMQLVAGQLAQQGHPLKTFAGRYAIYRQRLKELEADPATPRGFSSSIGPVLVRVEEEGWVGSSDSLLSNVRIDPCREFSDYVHRKYADPEEARLLLDPVSVLTPLWLTDLSRHAAHRKVGLFIDSYDRSAAAADQWLRDLLDDYYGPYNPGIVLVMACREKPDSQWEEYRELVLSLPLEPFTPGEAAAYLDRKGVPAGATREAILELSDRLPLWLAVLAAVAPEQGELLHTNTTAVVEQFLAWIPNADRRGLVSSASVPRWFTRETLSALKGEDIDSTWFDWLCSLPFVEQHGEVFRIHATLRMALLGQLQRAEPKLLADIHRRLVVWYREQKKTSNVNSTHEQPVEHALDQEAFYHAFCLAPESFFPSAIEKLAGEAVRSLSTALSYARTLAEAEADLGIPAPDRWGQRLLAGLEKEKYAGAVFEGLLKSERLPGRLRAALGQRKSISLVNAGRYQEALVCLDKAQALAPDYADAYLLRGLLMLLSGRLELAQTDLARTIGLDDREAAVFLAHGYVLSRLNQPEEALANYEQALERQPASAEAWYLQGKAQYELGRFEAALESTGQAIELKLHNAQVFRLRGEVLYALGRLEGALYSFDRALEFDLENAEIFHWRGIILHDLKRLDAALSSYDQALLLNPDNAVTYHLRGNVQELLGRPEEALASFDQAIAHQAEVGDLYHRRGNVLFNLGRLEEALLSFSRAIELSPGMAEFHNDRGNILRLLGRFDEARSDAEEAVRLDPDFSYSYATLAEIHALEGDKEEFFRYIQTALEKGCPVWNLLEDEAYASVRKDKRFVELLAGY